MQLPQSIDIFCRVIDNFGDAGVTWRLSQRFLALGVLRVRLVIDRPEVLALLVPELDHQKAAASRAQALGVEVCGWEAFERTAEKDLRPAGLVLETFGCRLPESYERAMAREWEARTASGLPVEGSGRLYMNLDYLSAESWIEACHNVWGLHPTLPIRKLWFFPGFTDRTGGVTIEDDYEERRLAFEKEKPAFLRSLGCDPEIPRLFLFAYPENALEALVRGLRALRTPLTVLAAPGGAGDAVQNMLDGNEFIRVVRPGFFPQRDFDRLLWASDALIVRGEDSFLRAQLAARPLFWATYATEDRAHVVKMKAWLARTAPLMPESVRALHERANLAWLEGDLPEDLFVRWWKARPELEEGFARWKAGLMRRGDLARHILERASAAQGRREKPEPAP